MSVLLDTSVPEIVPSLNLLMRMHWARRHKFNQRWAWLMLSVRPAVFKYHIPSRVTITRYSQKLLDPDNLYGSAKVIVDGLKAAHLIKDDKPSCLELVCNQEKSKSKKTQIKIEAINAVTADAD